MTLTERVHVRSSSMRGEYNIHSQGIIVCAQVNYTDTFKLCTYMYEVAIMYECRMYVYVRTYVPCFSYGLV